MALFLTDKKTYSKYLIFSGITSGPQKPTKRKFTDRKGKEDDLCHILNVFMWYSFLFIISVTVVFVFCLGDVFLFLFALV